MTASAYNRVRMAVSRMRHRWRVWRNRYRIILNYHRVTPNLGIDSQKLCTTPEHFQAQIEWLKSKFEIAPLEELAKGPSDRPRAALTFDDGYADNLHYALPILERHQVPVTVFVTSGYVGRDCEFWWDELERIVLLSEKCPRRVDLELEKQSRTWFIADPSKRFDLYQGIHACLKPLPPAEQEVSMTRLRECFDGVPPPRETHRPLQLDEVLELARSPLITIGAHTVNHVPLGLRPITEQEMEVRKSLDDLRKWTGKPVRVFSYPYGGAADIGIEAPRIVRNAGCVLARANWPGLVTDSYDRYQLPGLLVRNWEAATLESRLIAFLSSGSYDDN